MSLQRLGLAACALFLGAKAIDTITVPSVITAGTDFTLTVTPKDDDSSNYRIYLDTTPPGYAGGQSCYLKNSTSTDITSVNLTIPANFGPNGNFYSISTRDLSDSDIDSHYVFSNAFNLTGATGNYSEYENKLNGAPLWDANTLPCDSYNCARNCAQDSYPQDLTQGSDAYKTMTACILKCPGVEQKTSSSSSASASATPTKSGSGSGSEASTTGSSDSSSSASGTAASSSQTGAAAINMVPVSFAAVGGLAAFLL